MEIHQEMYEQLIKTISSYRKDEDLSMIKKAYELAVEAHKDQFRRSGEPYIIHPLAVAQILAELELDRESIVSGILHDVIEDTEYTYTDIKEMFSEDIANIVNGVTKLLEIKYYSKEDEQAENYRKMFLAMSTDIRVILVKMADRLHNMRTLEYMTKEKQILKARETEEIYAPLAHRLGIAKIRYELEDLCFKYLLPVEYEKLNISLAKREDANKNYINKVIEEIKETLESSGIKCKVEGRIKQPYSIYKKMFNKGKSFDEIHDLLAIRVYVDDLKDCYGSLGVMHELYVPVIGRIKDYIATPKENGYQSLHTTVIGPDGFQFEIQVRTYEMHRTAEYGIAAHWKYKGGDSSDLTKADAKLAWLRQILEWQQDVGDNEEFLDVIKGDLNLYKDRVYCFTPEGKVVDLPKGATPIDFAYIIHSAVGNKMTGAKIDGKIVPIDYVLKMGQQIEIITSNASKGPSVDWLKIAKSPNAKSKIRHYLREVNGDENRLRGKLLLEKDAKKKGYLLSELFTSLNEDMILKRYDVKTIDSLYSTIGYGGIKEGQVINRLIQEVEKNKPKEKVEIEDIKVDSIKSNSSIMIDKIGLSEVFYAKCCNPLPGDDICAFIARGGHGIKIHRKDCLNIEKLNYEDKERLRNAEWPNKLNAKKDAFTAKIAIEAHDRDGLLSDVFVFLGTKNIKVSKAFSTTDGIFANLELEIGVRSKEQLDEMITDISRNESIISVNRININNK